MAARLYTAGQSRVHPARQYHLRGHPLCPHAESQHAFASTLLYCRQPLQSPNSSMQPAAPCAPTSAYLICHRPNQTLQGRRRYLHHTHVWWSLPKPPVWAVRAPAAAPHGLQSWAYLLWSPCCRSQHLSVCPPIAPHAAPAEPLACIRTTLPAVLGRQRLLFPALMAILDVVC